MLQHTSLDDFLKGLYLNTVQAPLRAAKGAMTEEQKLLSAIMEGKEDPSQKEEDIADKRGPRLMFEDAAEAEELASQQNSLKGDNLRNLALANLKEKRLRQKQSVIFNAKDQKKKGVVLDINLAD